MSIIVAAVYGAVCGIGSGLLGIKILHIYQLEGYKSKGLFRWIARDNGALLIKYIFLSVVSFACIFVASIAEGEINKYAGIIVFAALSAYCIVHNFREEHKVKLVLTARLLRLATTDFILNIVVAFLLALLGLSLKISPAFAAFTPALGFLTIVAASAIMHPIEYLNRLRFILRAKSKLHQNPKLIKIGITGSFGKTSVKVILAELLSGKFKVCATPASFNTTMGICRAINENLNKNHEIFIAEMGARRRGDIAELTRLVVPDCSIITAIGSQHLETFKTLENIAQTKYEIIEGLKEGGFAVFNGGNAACCGLFEVCTHRKLLVATRGASAGISAYFDNVETGEFGSKFRLFVKGQAVDASTVLLGEHNIINITIAAAVAYELGVSIAEIGARIARLKPVPHRLELVSNTNGLNIIDDSYNANPQGVREALKVLSQFEGRKIIVTPGLVELGVSEAEENISFGKEIARVADYCIAVGKNALNIGKGLREGEFDLEGFFKVDSLRQARDILPSVTRAGDTVLFCNDLPDNY